MQKFKDVQNWTKMILISKHKLRRTLGAVCLVILSALPIIYHLGKNNVAFAASSDHLKTVKLYVGGKNYKIVSEQDSVKDLLNERHFNVAPQDLVEPSLDTPLEDGLRINIIKASPVTIIDNQSSVTRILTAYSDREGIAAAAGITLRPEDEVSIEQTKYFENDILPGKQYSIKRAKKVSINTYGQISEVFTQTKTVSELLSSQKIELKDGDSLVDSTLESALIEDQLIVIRNDSKEVITVEESIAYETKTTQDVNELTTYKKITTVGKNGKKNVIYDVQKVNGKEVNRTKVSETVIDQPVTQEVIVGTKAPAVVAPSANVGGSKQEWMAAVGISPADYGYVDYIITHESGWRYNATNPSSGAYGLCQALPASKLASAGSDWQTNPITQMRWCNSYALARYGSWANAYSFWIRNKWW